MGRKIRRKFADIVMVYFNPFSGDTSDTNEEGLANLIEKVESGKDADLWLVKFKVDDFITKRMVRNEYRKMAEDQD